VDEAVLYKANLGERRDRLHYGSRDIRVLLRRDACLVNATPVCRLYREICLRFCNKLSERRVKEQLRKNRSPPTEAKQIWDMD
jgi:hypothetical protein